MLSDGEWGAFSESCWTVHEALSPQRLQRIERVPYRIWANWDGEFFVVNWRIRPSDETHETLRDDLADEIVFWCQFKYSTHKIISNAIPHT